jgi:hypothetical protein
VAAVCPEWLYAVGGTWGLFNGVGQHTHQILFVYEWSCFLQVCSKHAGHSHGMFMLVGRAVLQSVVSWSDVWKEGLGEGLYNVCRRGAANHKRTHAESFDLNCVGGKVRRLAIAAYVLSCLCRLWLSARHLCDIFLPEQRIFLC